MDQVTCCSCGAPRGHPLAWRCECGGAFEIAREPRLDDLPTVPAHVRQGMWAYRARMRVPPGLPPVTLGEGGTPLLDHAAGTGAPMTLKLEHLSPSGSFKDRGMSVLASMARYHGAPHVVCDSSGNAGSSIAAYCSAAGIPCDVYAPEATSPGKLEQIQAYGARVVRVPGGRDDAAQAAQFVAGDAFYASHYWNPFFFEGTKTFALEAFEQLDRVMPDHVVFPVGHGSLFLGAVMGFQELAHLTGQDPPRCHVIQVEGFDPLVRASAGSEPQSACSEDTQTVAEGVRILHPLRSGAILGGLRATRGVGVTVNDSAIRRAFEAAQRSGLMLEPTSAVALAGVNALRARAVILDGERVLVPVTGNGLKTLCREGHTRT